MVGIGAVSIKATVNYRDSLGRIQAYASNPFTGSDIAAIRTELINNIRTRGSAEEGFIPKNLIGTIVSRKAKSPPYHTYPSKTKGQLEATSYVTKTSNSVNIGSTSSHASVLETGRGAITASDNHLCFKGYYPNRRILREILRARLPKRLNKVQKASRWGASGNEQYIQTLMEAYAHRGYGSHAYTAKKMLRGEAAAFQNPERYARSRGIEPTSTKYKDAQGVPYKYGIFTVLTRKVKAVEPYGVFSKTALWAKRTIVDKVKRRIVRMSGTSGGKVIQWH